MKLTSCDVTQKMTYNRQAIRAKTIDGLLCHCASDILKPSVELIVESMV